MPGGSACRNMSEKEPTAEASTAMESRFCIGLVCHISTYMFLVCGFMRNAEMQFCVTNIHLFFQMPNVK